jgi:hypothetical protein
MEFMICIALVSATKREIRKAGTIYGAGRAESLRKVEATAQAGIGWLREHKKLGAASFASDDTEDESGVVT